MFILKSFSNNNNIKKLLLKKNLNLTRQFFYCERQLSIFSGSENKTENVNLIKNVNESLQEFYLPEPPTAPEILGSLNSTELYNHLGEATFASLGLNSYWPTGWMQYVYETLHVSCSLPWWAVITISAVAVRVIMFPVSIKLRKLAVVAKKIGPNVTKLQKVIEEAKLSNDLLTVSKNLMELQSLLKKSNYKPYQTLIYSCLQMPPFLTIMMALRQMSNLPVASLQSGGALWFTDLTLCDPYYVLPCTTMLLLLLQLEIGADIGNQVKSASMKWLVRGFPLIGLIFTCNFPSALLLYWTCSSFISVGIVGMLKVPAVKNYLKMEDQVVVQEATTAPDKHLGFLQKWKKESAENKVFNRAKNLESSENERWIKAGNGPIPKTYTYNPTKVGSVQK